METNDNVANEALLESLPEGLTAVERIIMANEGTVQTLLSLLCGVPVTVTVISQLAQANIIIRWSKLVICGEHPAERTVCLAESIISESNPEGFLSMINEKQMGIGQIIKRIGLQTSRVIHGYHIDASTIARTYSIRGDCQAVITEVFDRRTIMRVARGNNSFVAHAIGKRIENGEYKADVVSDKRQ